MFDTDNQIEAVDREVGSRQLEEGEGATIVLSQTFETDIDDVWEACTDADRIPEWFLPISGELEREGQYQLEGNAGGTIEACDPPGSFPATWEFGGQVSWIELRLDEVGEGRTRLELEHVAPKDESWSEFGPGAAGVGWDLTMVGLATYLRTGQPVEQEQGQAWAASDYGKAFIRRVSRCWADAHVEAGEDDAVAQDAAERTVAFYTGV